MENGRYRKLTVDHIHNVEQDLIFSTGSHDNRTMVKNGIYLVKAKKYACQGTHKPLHKCGVAIFNKNKDLGGLD